MEVTRRKFVGITLFAIASTIGVLQPQVTSAQAKQRIYVSGETIGNKVAPIRIDKWRLNFDRKVIDTYLKRTNSGLLFYMSDFLDNAQSLSIGPLIFSLSTLASNTNYNHVYYTDKNIQMIALPPRFGHLTLDFFEARDRSLVRAESYFISPRYYTHKFEGDYAPRVFSEIPLGASLLEEIRYTCKLFDRFIYGNLPAVYVLEDLVYGDEDIHYDHTLRNVWTASKSFLTPDFRNHGMIVLYHELSHAIFESMKSAKVDEKQKNFFNDFEKLYHDWLNLAGASHLSKKTVAEMTVEDRYMTRTHPLLAIFKEGTYIKGSRSKESSVQGGHPYTGPTELFASIMTIYRFFPDDLIYRLNQLNPPEKKFIGLIAGNVLDILKLSDAPKKDLISLIPEYDKITESVK